MQQGKSNILTFPASFEAKIGFMTWFALMICKVNSMGGDPEGTFPYPLCPECSWDA